MRTAAQTLEVRFVKNASVVSDEQEVAGVSYREVCCLSIIRILQQFAERTRVVALGNVFFQACQIGQKIGDRLASSIREVLTSSRNIVTFNTLWEIHEIRVASIALSALLGFDFFEFPSGHAAD